MEKKGIYKMCDLLLIILPGKRDEIFGANFKCVEWLVLYLLSFGFIQICIPNWFVVW